MANREETGWISGESKKYISALARLARSLATLLARGLPAAV